MKNNRNTGIVRDAKYLDHRTGDGHPENSRRLESIYSMLDSEFMDRPFMEIPPRPARTTELKLIHSSAHIDRIAATQGKDYVALTPDTHTSANSYQAALLAAGGVLKAISCVVNGKLRNAFALIRPPGHHAEKNRAMGYCLFNNIALGAVYAKHTLGLDRILIVDWDVHHGNGTQHVFEDDPSVLFISTHQYPHYPGTGSFTEVGMGPGEGFTVNIPLSKGYGDSEYVSIFENLVIPVALEFAPQLILVSAGFDIHGKDPLGGMRVGPEGFAGLTRSLMQLADKTCQGKMVLALEGGYHQSSIGKSVKSVLWELAGLSVSRISDHVKKANKKKVAYVYKRCAGVHKPYWKCFRQDPSPQQD